MPLFNNVEISDFSSSIFQFINQIIVNLFYRFESKMGARNKNQTLHLRLELPHLDINEEGAYL